MECTRAVIDRTDRKIIAALVADARLSMTELAQRVHLSRTAVLARVRRLEAQGIIRGYHASVSLPGETGAISALMLLRFDVRPCAPVLAFLRGQAEVRQVWSLSGPHDAVIEVRVPDTVALSALADRLAATPFGISVDTRTVL